MAKTPGSLIPSEGKKYSTFSIIRHHNSPNRAEYRGLTFYRQEKIYVPEMRQFVMCASYDQHFIFEVPVRLKDSYFRCTCGSPAVIPGFGAYKHLASPTRSGYMLVCLVDTTFGHHADGDSRW